MSQQMRPLVKKIMLIRWLILSIVLFSLIVERILLIDMLHQVVNLLIIVIIAHSLLVMLDFTKLCGAIIFLLRPLQSIINIDQLAIRLALTIEKAKSVTRHSSAKIKYLSYQQLALIIQHFIQDSAKITLNHDSLLLEAPPRHQWILPMVLCIILLLL